MSIDVTPEDDAPSLTRALHWVYPIVGASITAHPPAVGRVHLTTSGTGPASYRRLRTANAFGLVGGGSARIPPRLSSSAGGAG